MGTAIITIFGGFALFYLCGRGVSGFTGFLEEQEGRVHPRQLAHKETVWEDEED